MQLATDIALSRLVAQQRSLEITSHNIANAGTPGFKGQRMVFADWIAPRSGGTSFTQDRLSYREMSAGTISHTGNPLDLAIAGEGWFTVDTPRGPRLTRGGRFTLGADGTITDQIGQKLLDNAGKPIQVSAADSNLTVAADGTLSSDNGQIARIGMVRPRDNVHLQAEGGDALRADVPTDPVAAPHVIQGALEESNVQPILAVSDMTNLLREFQFTTQFVQAESDRVKQAIDKLATPAA
jgi:flagellar basal-body rod protein FlgF